MRYARLRRHTSLYRFLALSITLTLSTILAIGTIALALKLIHRDVADIVLLVVVAVTVGVYNALAVMFIAPVGAFWED